MAIYHARFKTFSRAKQHSSAAAAAYRGGLLIKDPGTGQTHDYRRKGGIVETRIVAPEDAPDWIHDPRRLWPEAEIAERRRDATVAREFEIALPCELDDAQRSELTLAIAQGLVERYRFAIQASIHSPPTRNGLNHHAHLMATTRRVDRNGLAAKTWELDGGPSGRSEIDWIRAMIATVINDKLAAAGVDGRVDHRSLEEQSADALDRGDVIEALALAREPTQHIGKNATALHRKGMDCERIQTNQAINETNEASFEVALAQLGDAARLMPTPDRHTHEQARQERQSEGGFRLPVQLSESERIEQIRFDPTRTGSAVRAAAASDEGKAATTREALNEATRLWGEGFFTTISIAFKATTQLLSYQVDRLSAYVHHALFRADVRELLTQIKQVKRDALRFQRRMKTEDKAQHELVKAELLLERFDSDHPRPGQLSRQEWTRRRARRLRAVQLRQDAHRRVREATGAKAQADYNARALASAEALENWSAGMLARYPVDADQQPQSNSIEAPPSAVDPKGTPARRGPGL